ncbi:MAG: hypothetical protein AVDCRST_MAG69-633, partial [uncultured Solirubrobacteraceae bacterium]
MEETDLQLQPNEASDLTPVFGASVLEAHGWDLAFATVLDEAPAEDALALLVHTAGEPLESGWRALRVNPAADGDKGKTEDAEACTRHGGWLYLLGSQYGGKSGPLEASRSWIARVAEDDLAASLAGGERPEIEIVRLRFALHRAVNDALARAVDVELLPLGPRTRESYIDATIVAGAKGDKRWAGRVKSGDVPINVEAAEFRDDGRLLLGLRHPVTVDGHPILVELDDVESLFADPDAEPRCGAVWVLDGVGEPQRPCGVRALHAAELDHFHAIVGNLDAQSEDSVLIQDRPEAAVAESLHVSFRLP